MNTDQLNSFIRSLFKVIGAGLATHGFMTAANIVNSQDIIGLVLTAIGVLASHNWHKDTLTTPPPAPTAGKLRGSPLFLVLLLPALLLGSGCAHFSKSGDSKREIVKYGAAVPPGWSVIQPVGSLNAPLDETNEAVNFAAVATTNTASGFMANKPVIFVAYRETWTDHSKGGGTFVFTDPAASQISSVVSNQAALAGNHQFTLGNINSTVTTNDVAIVGATGAAIGNVIGQVIKTTTPVGAAGGAASSAVSAVTPAK